MNASSNEIPDPTAATDRLRLELEERHRTESALHASEERFRQMADAIPEVIWFTALDPEEVLYVSPSFERIWGLRVEELYKNPRLWIQTIHPNDRERVNGIFSGWITGVQGNYQDLEYRIVQPGGAVRWIHERGVLTREKNGKPLRLSGISTDITERKQAEENLRRSKAYLAEAQRLSRTGSFGWCVANGEVVWSDETFCILGYDRSVKPALDLVFNRVHPDDLALVRQTLDHAIRESTGFDFEHRFLMPDGKVKHVHIVARAGRDGSGGVEFVGAVMDITERKRASEALRALEHLARGQLEALTGTLAALARESEPEKLLEHVLKTIGSQLQAHSLGLYELDEGSGRVQLVADCEGGRLRMAKPDEVQSSAKFALVTQPHPIWTEFFRTGAHSVIGDIRADGTRVRLADVPDAPWYEWSSDVVANPTADSVMKQIRAAGIVSTLAVPTFIAGKVTGLIIIRFKQQRSFRPEEIELSRALSHQAMLAIRLIRLSQQSRQAAVIAERNRMARDIHDTLAQGFTGVIMQLEAAKGAIAQNDLAEVSDRVERAGELARASLSEARRSVLALRPHSLQDASLCMALDDLFKRMTRGSGLQAEFRLDGEEPTIPAEWEEGLLRIAQESLTNAIKHAKAKNFSAILSVDASETQFHLVDDGVGFDLHAEHEGFGLLGMKERVDQMGGQFFVRSIPGQGTEIQVILKNPTQPNSDNGGEHA